MDKRFFEVGKKYTLYRISFMAITSKSEIQVTEILDGADDPRAGVVFKLRGKRKQYILPFASRDYASAPLKPFEGAVFEGWDQPVKCDSEGCSYRGNACYNFVGDPEAVRLWIDAFQMNPAFDRSKVLAVGLDSSSKETVVYPDLYQGGHAVIDRVLAGSIK